MAKVTKTTVDKALRDMVFDDLFSPKESMTDSMASC